MTERSALALQLEPTALRLARHRLTLANSIRLDLVRTHQAVSPRSGHEP